MQEPHFIEVGKKLKTFREDTGYTQAEVATLFGVSKHAISQWETGRKLPSTENLDRMVDVYRIPSGYLNFIHSLVIMSKNELIKILLDLMHESEPHALER